MTSIHDSFDFIKKISVFRTSEEIDAIEDDDIRQEVIEDDMQFIRDTLDRIINEARTLEAHRPYDYVDMSGGAIREHYVEGEDDEDALSDLTDQDLQDAGEWALHSELLWDSIYSAWDYGIASTRNDKQREEKDVSTT